MDVLNRDIILYGQNEKGNEYYNQTKKDIHREQYWIVIITGRYYLDTNNYDINYNTPNLVL